MFVKLRDGPLKALSLCLSVKRNEKKSQCTFSLSFSLLIYIFFHQLKLVATWTCLQFDKIIETMNKQRWKEICTPVWRWSIELQWHFSEIIKPFCEPPEVSSFSLISLC